MLAKLLLMLSASKGAVVAAAVVLGASTVTVGSSSPEIQDAVHAIVQTVTGETSETARTFRADCGQGQPAVVAQRNAATKLVDAAFQVDHKALVSLHGKGVDNKAAGALVKDADDQLKDLRTKALNDVAALTLGREGQNKPSGSPSTSASPKPSASPCPSGSPEAAESPKPSPSPKAEGSAKPSEQGRVTVANRTTLDANIKAIVDQAIADMDQLVKDTTALVDALPAPDHGKPSDDPGNKPAENPGDEHKPSGSPKH